MGKKTILLTLSFFTCIFLYAQSADEKIIRHSMNEQKQAWNAGDINAYMTGYWQSDSSLFIGKKGITYGWGNAKKNYLKGYPDTAAMGKLDFDIISIKRLSVMYFFVIGKWHLTKSTGDISGHFTLLFKKVKDKWVIVADHNS